MTEQSTTYQDETGARIVRTPIFISGLPGKMATLIAETLAQNESYDLLPLGMSSRKHNFEYIDIHGQKLLLRDFCPKKSAPGTIAIDFTTPQNATLNAIHYVSLGIPFVMGTTGGDRRAMEEAVRSSQISAVIAPNMAVSIVEVQDEIKNLIDTSPNAYLGWRMTIRESHQATKRDVSGTAKALQAQLERLGAVMEGEIESIRDPQTQRQLGIQNLEAHGYHWITLTSPQGEVKRYPTVIEGRQPYVNGTLMAVKFLARKMREGSRGEVFTMSDVIEDARRST